MTGVLFDDDTTGATLAAIEPLPTEALAVADWSAASVQGRARGRNEDRWRQLGSIFAVADGMGGTDSGGAAASLAIEMLVDRWFIDPDQALVPLVTEINRAVLDGRRAAADSSGSTLSAVRIAADQATVVHVGDSRIYRFRADPNLPSSDLLTRDHTLETEMLAARVAPRAHGSRRRRGSLTSYLGMASADLRIEVRRCTLAAGDRLVLCTDGVFAALGPREVNSRARAGSAAATVKRLIADYGADDATAVVVDIGRLDDGLTDLTRH